MYVRIWIPLEFVARIFLRFNVVYLYQLLLDISVSVNLNWANNANVEVDSAGPE